MPSPATTEEFLDLVQKSAVVEEKRLSVYVEKARTVGGLPIDPRQTAALFVRDGILTNFQAEQILQGKWKRFTIGKYKVLERLGAGGMGSVYLCEHKLMRRRVAVKVLPTAKAEDPSSLERFYREARAVAALDHPNIVRAYDIDQDDKLHFLVMEHVDGASLQEIIKKNGPMDVLRACHYMRQAALGLQHAHDAAGLVHRDIKPGNILVDRNGIVKILDMGLARFFYDEEDVLTKKYDENVLGTADYLAPEQATDSHAVDIRADIYSLGATFYFCLTGRTPFQEGTVAQKLIWHQTRLPKPIRTFRPEVPEGVVAIIDKAMSKDATARYQSPQEMGQALSEWTTTPIPPPPENEMPKLSLAALGGTVSDNSLTATARPSTPNLDSPSPRKTWQVPTTPAPGTLSRPNPMPIAQAPPSGARSATGPASTPTVTTPPATVRPTAAPTPQAKSQPASNGMPRGGPPVAPVAIVAHPPPLVTDRVRPADSSTTLVPRSRTAHSPLAALTNRPWLIFAAVAVVALFALVAGGGVLLIAFLPTPTTSPPPDPARAPRYYKKTNDQGEPVRFEDFMASARTNDRLILQDDVVAAEVTITVKQLTIEAEPGKTITWSYPPRGATDGTLVRINSAEGLVLKGITLDGGGRAKTLVNLFGRNPGLTMKNVQFKGFKKYGIHVTNCEGSPEKYIELNGLSFTTTATDQIALYFDIQPNIPSIPVNRYFRIRDCTFDGKGISGRIAPKTAVKNMDVQDNLKDKVGEP